MASNKKKYTITDAQLKRIKTKYERLMYAVSYRIGGDRILSSLEDSVQDLYMSAFDACEAYERKTGLLFDDYFDTVEFDKYIKATLWNKKNNTGKKIQKTRLIHNHITIDDNIIETEANTVYEDLDVSSLLFDVKLDSLESEITEHILKDRKMVKPNGSINLSKLSRLVGKDKRELVTIIEKLRVKYKDYGDEN
tara:strand:- start:1242 stop:1823 length:582 start_codon:yes stop_codon:yes gene_type:complete